MGEKKVPVDNSEFLRTTEFPLRDKIFNAIVRQYGRKGNPWKKSDGYVWGGAVYQLFTYVIWSIGLWLLWLLLRWTVDHKGVEYAILYVLALVFTQLIRVNTKLSKIDKNFK